MSERCESARYDRGQATVLLLAIVVVVAVLTTAIGDLGKRISDRETAQLAADAAALAGVVGGRDAAERLAGFNGALLVHFELEATEVYVEVRVGNEHAWARSTRAP